jgi:Na+/proline symporter
MVEITNEQIFHDHFPFIVIGIIFGILLSFIPAQDKRAKIFSTIFLCIALFYPIIISLLYFNRANMGESYAYLIYGLLTAILLSILAGITFVIWLLFYILSVSRRKNPLNCERMKK